MALPVRPLLVRRLGGGFCFGFGALLFFLCYFFGISSGALLCLGLSRRLFLRQFLPVLDGLLFLLLFLLRACTRFGGFFFAVLFSLLLPFRFLSGAFRFAAGFLRLHVAPVGFALELAGRKLEFPSLDYCRGVALLGVRQAGINQDFFVTGSLLVGIERVSVLA